MAQAFVRTRSLIAASASLAAWVATVGGVAGQEPPAVTGPQRWELAATVTDDDLSGLRRLDNLVDALARTDELALASRFPDRQLSGREHESFRQYHNGIPVHGGGVSRQLAGGVAVSIFGTIHRDIDMDTIPGLSADEALARIERRAGTGPATDDPPELVILPYPFTAGYALVWRATMRDFRTYFLDARTGAVVHVEHEVREQGAAVGVGSGILNDRKKLSTSQAGGAFQAYDRLRPAEIVTLDLRYNEARQNALNDPRGPSWAPSDVASDADNDWSDPAVVDGHAHLGFTYDYLAARHGWGGIDGRNGRILSMVNIGVGNAFWISPPFGPEGLGVVAFGAWDDGAPLVSADIVAHEVMHGVTHYLGGAAYGLRLGWNLCQIGP